MTTSYKGTPPVYLPIYLRTYAREVAAADSARPDGTKKGGRPKGRNEPPASRFTLIFDTETTIDPSQRLRVGVYQLRDGDRIDEERIFCDHDALTDEELKIAEAYSQKHFGLPLMTLSEFREEVLIGRGLKIGATIVTFNGPFDFARIAIDYDRARAGKYRKKMRGGFSFKISEDHYAPRIQIKHLNPRASIVELTAPKRQETPRSRRQKGERTPVYRGSFIDVKTIASALLTGSYSLARLTEALNTATQKQENEDHGEGLSAAYLDYARSDVQATWECYVKLRYKYALYGFDAPLSSLISEASLGKAALDSMGIKPWRQVQPGAAPSLISLIQSTYFGGRTEVRIRRKLTRVLLTDFTSMYPTVCTLQGLWSFVTADGFSHRDATEEIRQLVEVATPESYRTPPAWRKLTALVKLKPDFDLLPIRADYPGHKHATIGCNYLTYDGELWITLADCLAAKFLSGKAPHVEKALIFEPNTPQAGLTPINMFGRYKIDPYKDDLFRELIRHRQLDEQRKSGKSEAEQAKIEAVREAAKITANATGYGIWAQSNVTAEPKGASVEVFRADGSSFKARMTKVEEPGPWFNPLLATLITGAARLMLALAERQTMDQGLDWAFCDTDSLAIAMPEGMDGPAFEAKGLQVVAWFSQLNPYGFDDSILKVEKVNFAINDPKRLAPLYCWAISSKRYALFNLGEDGRPVIRKASAHGLGHLVEPYKDKDAPSCFPKPQKSVLSGREKLKHWQYDAWFAMLEAALAGKPDSVKFDYHPALAGPTASRYAATSPALLNWFKTWNAGKPYASAVKPFGFLYTLHLRKTPRNPDEAPDPLEMGSGKHREVHPVAPFARTLKDAVAQAFDRLPGAPVAISELETYAEVLKGYPRRPEPKFLNGEAFDKGRTERRHLVATLVQLIGKEADAYEQTYFLGLNEDPTIHYGADPRSEQKAYTEVRKAAALYGDKPVADATGLSRSTVRKLREGQDALTNISHHQIAVGVAKLDAERRSLLAERARWQAAAQDLIQKNGLRGAARSLGTDASNLLKRVKLFIPVQLQ